MRDTYLYTATKMNARRSDWDLKSMCSIWTSTHVDVHRRTLCECYFTRLTVRCFFQLATDTHSFIRGHTKKLFVPQCSTTVYSSEVILLYESDQQCWNALSQHVVDAQPTNAFKNRLDKHWTDMGAWKFQIRSPSTSSTSTSKLKKIYTGDTSLTMRRYQESGP